MAGVDLVAEAPVERSVVTEDPLLDILDGDLDEFLAEPAEESYSVRTSGGDILGPYTASQISGAAMLSSGMLLGAEEVSTDDENWSILAQHPAFAGQVDQTQLIEAGAMDAPAFPMVDPRRRTFRNWQRSLLKQQVWARAVPSLLRSAQGTRSPCHRRRVESGWSAGGGCVVDGLD